MKNIFTKLMNEVRSIAKQITSEEEIDAKTIEKSSILTVNNPLEEVLSGLIQMPIDMTQKEIDLVWERKE